MARQRNPRRILLEQLRDMKRKLDRVIHNWDTPSTVFEPRTETRRCDPQYYRHLPVGEDGLVAVELHTGSYRKREAHEYPENQRAEWAFTCHALDALIREAGVAREAAYQRWLALDPSISPAK